ncbi:MAG: serpin family protein [Candidatus Bathyarchaeota archaeon]|nr:serpin family protein [Candidatus Termiticorpusculum sp.]
MKNKRVFAVFIAILVVVSLFISLIAYTSSASDDLMKGIKPNELSLNIDIKDGNIGAVDFSIWLFQNSMSDKENTIMSPLSVLCALAMVANGADGDTLSQIESVFGVSIVELNGYLQVYLKSLSSDDKASLDIANSVWIRDDGSILVVKDFLQTNADYYDASIFKALFDDGTLKDINGWVSEKTHGMIKSILNEISPYAVMYLINAIAFDAEWEQIYNESNVRPGIFTSVLGQKRDVQMMYSTEGVFLNDKDATGFMKYYAGRKYAFVAMLPNEGTSVNDYISTLTGLKIVNLLNDKQQIVVNVAVPKFESAYSIDLNDILSDMGMSAAFDSGNANFSRLASSTNRGNIYISKVTHKAIISVDEKGTKAGAATAIELSYGSVPLEPSKTVYLDRPFVYMIIDCEANIPVFIGTILDL